MSSTDGTAPLASYQPETTAPDQYGVQIYWWSDGCRVDIAPGNHGRPRLTAFEGDEFLTAAHVQLSDLQERERFAQHCAPDDVEAARAWLKRLTALDALRSRPEMVPQPGAPPVATPFPLHMLPTPLRVYVTQCSRSLPCPEDFIGVPMLSGLGVAIGRTREVEVKPGWYESARVWSAVIGDPGSKKSPALDLVMQPLYAVQQQQKERYEEQKTDYENKLADYEKAMAQWRRERKDKGSERPVKPSAPVFPQTFSTDATVEAFAMVLEANPRGILFLRDELTAWVGSMNQYKGGKGSDRQSWLSFWNGAPVLVNRKTRPEPIILRHPFVAVAGCLPLEVLGDLSDEQGRNDGFVYRVLFSYPAPVALEWTEESITPAIQAGYSEVIERLWALTGDKDGRPKVLAMTAPGRKAYVAWVKKHYAEMDHADLEPYLRGPWAKMEGYCARLALILHLARYACAEVEREAIDEVSVQGAVELIDYFKAHARLVYRYLRHTPEDRRLEQARTWIARHGGEVSVRDLITYKVADCRTMRDGDALMTTLVEHGYGSIIEEMPTTGGRLRRVFRLSK